MHYRDLIKKAVNSRNAYLKKMDTMAELMNLEIESLPLQRNSRKDTIGTYTLGQLKAFKNSYKLCECIDFLSYEEQVLLVVSYAEHCYAEALPIFRKALKELELDADTRRYSNDHVSVRILGNSLTDELMQRNDTHAVERVMRRIGINPDTFDLVDPVTKEQS
ncbi:hypothetical protein [Neptuniibacter sp. QD37_11]|uniref:hypothetical protein n=1 Tax=Neptuniibacter sp. QD37_11 TaxID=3398209 RepID=UPI0039F4AC6C